MLQSVYGLICGIVDIDDPPGLDVQSTAADGGYDEHELLRPFEGPKRVYLLPRNVGLMSDGRTKLGSSDISRVVTY